MLPHYSREILQLLGDTWVLVVEPTSNIRASLKQFLTNLRIKNLRAVGTSAEAKKIILQKKVGLFIVEWLSPDQNGLQFRRELAQNKKTKDVPFLLLSAENLNADVILAGEMGIDGYLLKPFSYDEFCQKILDILTNKKQPSPAEVLLDSAEKHALLGDFTRAEEQFLEALQLKPESARALCGIGRIAIERGNTEKAKVFLTRATQNNPYFVEAYRALIQLYEATKESPSLIQTAETVHALSPENPKYSMVLAKAHLEAGNLELSEKFFRETVRISPKLATAYKGLGGFFLLKGDYTASKKYYEKALDLDDSDVSVLNGLGSTAIRQGLMADGIRYYLMALRLDSGNSKIKFNLGHAYEKNFNFERAAFYFQQVLREDPSFEKARLALERVLKNTDNKL